MPGARDPFPNVTWYSAGAGRTAESPSITVAADADAAAWDTFVSTHSGSTGYHEWAWRRVFRRAFGHECLYLAAHRDVRIVGILPLVHIKSVLFGRTLTSLPFLNCGGVVAEDELAARRLVDAAVHVAGERGCRHVELRHIGRRFPDLPCRQHKVAMLLPLERGMWGRLDRKVRNQIRKAQKSQLTAERGGPGLLDDFYAVFARNMRDLGTPVYSPRLFREVLDAFPGRATLHVIRLGRRPIAAGLAYRTGTTIEVPWASSVRDFNNLCPNHLLYWSTIESAIEDGCHVLDFGRSTPNEGTYNFKAQWGAQPVELHWEYALAPGRALPNISPSNPTFSLAIELWKRLPLPIANRIGPSIVRAIP